MFAQVACSALEGTQLCIVFRQKPLGVSDSMLLKQRRASAAASRVLCCGADLDLSLMMADGDSQWIGNGLGPNQPFSLARVF